MKWLYFYAVVFFAIGLSCLGFGLNMDIFSESVKSLLIVCGIFFLCSALDFGADILSVRKIQNTVQGKSPDEKEKYKAGLPSGKLYLYYIQAPKEELIRDKRHYTKLLSELERQSPSDAVLKARYQKAVRAIEKVM